MGKVTARLVLIGVSLHGFRSATRYHDGLVLSLVGGFSGRHRSLFPRFLGCGDSGIKSCVGILAEVRWILGARREFAHGRENRSADLGSRF